MPVLRQTLHVPWATRAVRRSRAIERERERGERGPYIEERLAGERERITFELASGTIIPGVEQTSSSPCSDTGGRTDTDIDIAGQRGGVGGRVGGYPGPRIASRPRLTPPLRDTKKPWQAPRRSQPALGPAWPAACAMRCAPALLPVAFRSDRSPLPTVSHRARTRVRRLRRRRRRSLVRIRRRE